MNLGFIKLFRLNCKRAVYSISAVASFTCLLCIAAGIFLTAVFSYRNDREEAHPYSVVYVGDISGYMGVNVESVTEAVSDSFGADLTKMSLEDAKRELLLGHISTYIVFPEGFIEAVDRGDNEKKIIYVTAEGERGLSGMVLSESLSGISRLVTTTQNAYTSAYLYLKSIGREDLYNGVSEKLDKSLIGTILGLMNSSELKTVGVSNGLSFTGYYICAVTVLFTSLLGIGAASFFGGREKSALLYEKRDGGTATKQVISEFLAFSLLMLISFLFISGLMLLCVGSGFFKVNELGKNPVGALIKLLMTSLPAVVMLYAAEYLIYELFKDTVGSVMAQFMVFIVLGFASGYFYPQAFLPEALVRFSSFLPTGAALNLVISEMAGNTDVRAFVLNMAYLAVFLFISILLRERRLRT